MLIMKMKGNIPLEFRQFWGLHSRCDGFKYIQPKETPVSSGPLLFPGHLVEGPWTGHCQSKGPRRERGSPATGVLTSKTLTFVLPGTPAVWNLTSPCVFSSDFPPAHWFKSWIPIEHQEGSTVGITPHVTPWCPLWRWYYYLHFTDTENRGHLFKVTLWWIRSGIWCLADSHSRGLVGGQKNSNPDLRYIAWWSSHSFIKLKNIFCLNF